VRRTLLPRTNRAIALLQFLLLCFAKLAILTFFFLQLTITKNQSTKLKQNQTPKIKTDSFPNS
jgi:uncharacterized membrane protein affecting hemolysin expression